LTEQLNQIELKKILENIKKNSLYPQKVQIIAVTKTLSYEAIKAAYKNNILNVGESKIQEIEKKTQKKEKLKNLKIHLIGHLQRNKAKKAVLLCDYIQSVDSIKIAEKINKEASLINKIQKIYLQINIGEDDQKHGFSVSQIFSKCDQITQMSNLQVVGIMTILPQAISEQKIKKLFLKTKQIKDKIEKTVCTTCTELSMGMSGDYKIALKMGATNIRIGTRLYGKR
tara:strand:+ start:30497 stop:31177 length:681 start_codon:yes stop_codon:yes gene_type:complete